MKSFWVPPWERIAQNALGGVERAFNAGRRVWAKVRPPRGLVFFHKDYRYPQNPILDYQRSEKILGYCLRLGCVGSTHVRAPKDVAMHKLAEVHDFSYLESVSSLETLTRIFGHDIQYMDVEVVIRCQRRMVAGTVEAARAAVERQYGAQYMVNLGGGFHHASREHGGGFCLFNDVAVAVKDLRNRGFEGKILVVDLDLHHGDGTRRIFAHDESVYTFSVHASSWDESPAVANYDLELHSGIGDHTYLQALRRALPLVFKEADPKMVFYVAGVDVALDDRQGNWRLTEEGIFSRDRALVEATGDLPMVWTLAGGYGRDAWRHSARSLCWLLGEKQDVIPSGSEAELERSRRIAAQLTTRDLSQGEGEDDLFEDDLFRAEDLFADLWGAKKPSKLLGFYSKTGMETALERYGILPHIREVGFSDLVVEMTTEDPRGQILKIKSRPEDHLLLDLVLRDRREHTPYRLLSIEWLLMQNPLVRPTPQRPLLPGQKHPGLGALRKLFLMWVMACERLQFDGIQFCPSHYHVAAQARGYLSFLKPQDASWFAAMEEALEGLPLAKATQVVHDKGLVDGNTGKLVEWRPSAMVLPVSEELKRYFRSQEYQSNLEEASQHIRIERTDPRVVFSEN